LKQSCPGGRWAGQIKNINFFLFHFSVDTMAQDHVEKIAYFQEKSLEFVNREEYSLKIRVPLLPGIFHPRNKKKNDTPSLDRQNQRPWNFISESNAATKPLHTYQK